MGRIRFRYSVDEIPKYCDLGSIIALCKRDRKKLKQQCQGGRTCYVNFCGKGGESYFAQQIINDDGTLKEDLLDFTGYSYEG